VRSAVCEQQIVHLFATVHTLGGMDFYGSRRTRRFQGISGPNAKINFDDLSICRVALGGLVVLATGPKVRGFDPDRGRWIFKGDKIYGM
jgi:hypothetical protein